MTLEHKKNIFVALGEFLSQFSEVKNLKKEAVLNNDLASLSSTASRVFFESFIQVEAITG